MFIPSFIQIRQLDHKFLGRQKQGH